MAGQGAKTRRSVLTMAAAGIGAAMVSPAILVNSAFAARRPIEARSLRLYNLHTGDSFDTVYWERGGYIPAAVRRINWVLRDHRTDEVHPIDIELIELLARLHQRLSTNEPFEVISGYRSPATNALLAANTDGVAQNSLHMQGMAADIRVPGRSLIKLRRAAVMMDAGGVGYYPRSDFVHVDVGRVRYW